MYKTNSETILQLQIRYSSICTYDRGRISICYLQGKNVWLANGAVHMICFFASITIAVEPIFVVLTLQL